MPIQSKTDKRIWYYKEDETIIKEGEPNNQVIYILNYGELGVYKGGQLVARISGSGAFIGEMSSILDQPRTATVKAIRRSKITQYTGGLDLLIEQFPHVAAKLLTVITTRLAEVTREYQDSLVEIDRLKGEIAKLTSEIKDLKEQNAQMKRSSRFGMS